MKHVNRITVEARRSAFKLPAMGWATIYALAALGFGALAFYWRNP